jgi:hypothetical protein
VDDYLKIKFPGSKKLTCVAAQKFFYHKYSKYYDEKYPNAIYEKFPPDRKIVTIPLTYK